MKQLSKKSKKNKKNKKNKKTKKIKKQIGKGFIAEGNTACVFSDPPLECEHRNLNIEVDNLVSKVFPPNERSTALAEFKLAKILQNIDPENELCIYPLKIIPGVDDDEGCIIYVPPGWLDGCTVLTYENLVEGGCTIIYMKKAGEKISDIKNMILRDDFDIDFSTIIKNFIYTLGKFQKLYSNVEEGYLIHNDLSEENIKY